MIIIFKYRLKMINKLAALGKKQQDKRRRERKKRQNRRPYVVVPKPKMSNFSMYAYILRRIVHTYFIILYSYNYSLFSIIIVIK